MGIYRDSAKVERNLAMLESRRRGETLAVIGHRWGVSRERVRQIVRQYEANERFQLLPSPEQLYTAMQELFK